MHSNKCKVCDASMDKQGIKSHSESFSRKSYCIAHLTILRLCITQ